MKPSLLNSFFKIEQFLVDYIKVNQAFVFAQSLRGLQFSRIEPSLEFPHIEGKKKFIDTFNLG